MENNKKIIKSTISSYKAKRLATVFYLGQIIELNGIPYKEVNDSIDKVGKEYINL